MTFWMVVFIVLMIIWLVFGIYWGYEPTKPYGLGNTLIPWACVAILGYCYFNGIGGGVIR